MNLYELDNSKSPRKKIAEISDKVMHDYRRQAHYDIQGHKFGSKKDDPNAADIIAKREKGMAQAGNKITARRDAEMAQRREAENQRLRDKYAGVDIDAEIASLKPAMDRAYHEYQYGARNTWSQGRDDYQRLSGKMAELQRAKAALGEGMAEGEEMATFSALKDWRVWDVHVFNNFYRGKYADYGPRLYSVVASSPDEARQVVIDNADYVLQDLLSRKLQNGKKVLPRGSALPIEDKRVGKAEPGTITTMAFKKMLSPDGVQSFKFTNGKIVDGAHMQGGEEVAEGSLNEFAPSDDNGDNEPNEYEILHRLAAMWWLGTEQQMIKAERALASMGWEIGEDEGYDDGGVFVVRANDEHGKSYISWPHEDLQLNEQGVAEGTDDLRDSVLDVLKAIYNGSSSGEYMIDTLADEFGQYYDEVEASGDQSLQNAYSFMMDNGQEADGDPQAMAQIAKQAISMLTQGVAEGTQTVGHEILGLLRQVKRQGDDAMEELYSSCPLLAQFWDQYEGDFRSLVVELSPKTLHRIKAEIAAFNQQGEELGEGKHKCTCHPGDADPDCPVHGLEPMDVGDALDVKEGVAASLPMADAVKVLKQYGAEHFKTGSESLNFYKGGKAYKLELSWNDDTTRSVGLSELNHVVRTLKAQDNKFNFNPSDNWSQDFETRMSKGMAEGQLNELSPELLQRYQDQADATGDKKRMQGSKIADYKLGNRFRYGGDSREAKITARRDAKQAADKAANPQQSDQSYGHGGFDSDRNSIKFGRTYNESAEGVAEDNYEVKKHVVLVTIVDPDATAVSQRGALRQRRCKVRAVDQESAVNTAIRWYRKQGYKVMDHLYAGLDDSEPLRDDTSDLNELSNELLGRYKKELGVRASAADKAGDYDKGHEYFKKINKATIRQGENDARKHERENQNEMMETRLNMMRKAGYDL
jgi:hypothetical protein